MGHPPVVGFGPNASTPNTRRSLMRVGVRLVALLPRLLPVGVRLDALLARWLAAPPLLGYNIHQIHLLSSLTED